MRFAIFSDIHANLQAWEAVLADIREQGADTLVCLGDVVGYGPMPGPVLESVYQFTDNFVLGNHDAVVGGRIDAATFNEHAQYVIKWTAEQLGDEGAAFFAQVPLTLRGDRMLFTHGDAARPGHFDYVVQAEDARPSFQACKDEVIFFGHTHEPGVFACASTKGIIDKLPGADLVLKPGRRYMINPGSVGDPRSPTDLRASYCLYDDTTRRLTFRKVEFDVDAYRADLAASGLETLPYFLRVIDAGSRRPEEVDELALVQDHREEVEVDESMAVQPRALVTVGSPMADRPKMHFGYAHPQHPGFPGTHPAGMPVPPLRAGLPQAWPMPPLPPQPKPKRHGAAVLIVGVLLGIIGLIFAFSQFSGPSAAELADVDTGHTPDEKAGKREELLSAEDGWEDAVGRREPEKKPEPVKQVEPAAIVQPAAPIKTAQVAELEPAPVFSLSSLQDRPFERYGIRLPDGVRLVREDEFGGLALNYAAGAPAVEIRRVEEIDFGGSISVAAWIKLKPADHERVIFGRIEGTSRWMYLAVTPADSPKPGCVVFGGVGVKPESVRSSSAKRVDDDRWHFVVGMHDGEEGKLRIYLDGEISKAANCQGTFPRITGPMSIGGGGFQGRIYGMRIYDWALQTGDARKIFAGRK